MENFNRLPKESNGYKLINDKNALSNYLSFADRKDDYKLCIIGKDPYPEDSIGIPFCKIAINDKTCSGYYLLTALGISIKSLNYKYTIDEVIQIFYDLINKDVLFLNSSYYFLNKENLSKNKHLDLRFYCNFSG